MERHVYSRPGQDLAMMRLRRGKYQTRLAESAVDLAACQRLRMRAFKRTDGHDIDAFDGRCTHVMVETIDQHQLVACFRLLPLTDGRLIQTSYSAQFYDLESLHSFDGKLAELGRFCVDPDTSDPDILRVAWGAITRYVDATKVDMLFGCSSFPGTTPDSHTDAFALLKDRHLGPLQWRPRIKSPCVFPFSSRLNLRAPNLKQAMLGMPPLLRSYLVLGGWVSDHAVVDVEMNTLHVFTGLEIRAIPDARKRLLRAAAS